MDVKNIDFAVIGLGAVGAATVYHLSGQGKKVIGLDQYAPPHEFGSTHGETRISRLAVGEGADFLPLVRRSHQLWKDLESKSGKKIFYQVGGVLMDSGNQSWAKHGSKGFFENTVSLAKESDIPHEVFDAGELKNRFREFNLPEKSRVYYEPSAGYLLPELAVSTQLSLAESQGARIMTHTKVLGIQPLSGGGVLIRTNHGTIEAGQVCISAGAWIKDFIPSFIKPHFKVCRQILHWLPIEPGYFSGNNFPVYMWGFGPNPEDFIYGFPSLNGKTVKMATESFVPSHHPDGISRSISADEQALFIKEKLRSKYNGLLGTIASSKVCIYTVTPDAYFVVDRLPDFPEVLVASACSGHGFKHSAALGESITHELLGKTPLVPLKPFRWPSTFN